MQNVCIPYLFETYIEMKHNIAMSSSIKLLPKIWEMEYYEV